MTIMLFLTRLYCISNKLGGTNVPLFIEPRILCLLGHLYTIWNQNYAFT